MQSLDGYIHSNFRIKKLKDYFWYIINELKSLQIKSEVEQISFKTKN